MDEDEHVPPWREIAISPHLIMPFWPKKGEPTNLERLGVDPFKNWEKEQARLRRERGEPEPEPVPPKRSWWQRLLRREAA